MRTDTTFWSDLGLTAPTGRLGDALKVRIEEDLLLEVDRIEAFARGAGYRVTRSDIVRVALASFVEGFLHQVPEVATVTLPSERRSAADNTA